MTDAEFTAAVAKRNELQAAKDEAHQSTIASIAAAKRQNDITREWQAKTASYDKPIADISEAINTHVAAVSAEKHRIAVEAAKAEAAENARKEAEAAAAKAQEQSELQLAQAEVAALKEQLAAKG